MLCFPTVIQSDPPINIAILPGRFAIAGALQPPTVRIRRAVLVWHPLTARKHTTAVCASVRSKVMLIQFWGDGSGFEFRIRVKWQVLIAFSKALAATIIILAGLLVAMMAAPAV